MSAPTDYLGIGVVCGVWCGVVWCGVWRGVAWRGVVWCGGVWCGVVWCGVVWCGVVWCGVVWCGVVWCGVVWCGVVCDVVWRPSLVFLFSFFHVFLSLYIAGKIPHTKQRATPLLSVYF